MAASGAHRIPIRFYCPFCDQLLGISSRKAGKAITCPRCHGEVGVPGPDESPPLDILVPLPEPSPSGDLVLTGGQVAALALASGLLLAVAFAAGLLIGALG